MTCFIEDTRWRAERTPLIHRSPHVLVPQQLPLMQYRPLVVEVGDFRSSLHAVNTVLSLHLVVFLVPVFSNASARTLILQKTPLALHDNPRVLIYVLQSDYLGVVNRNGLVWLWGHLEMYSMHYYILLLKSIAHNSSEVDCLMSSLPK